MKVWDFWRNYLLRATGKDLSGTGKGFSRANIWRTGALQNNTLNSISFLFAGFGIELADNEIRNYSSPFPGVLWLSAAKIFSKFFGSGGKRCD